MKNNDDKLFSGKIIIILAEELKSDSYRINIQNFTISGESYIPIFLSVEDYNESTKGTVDNPIIEIDGYFFLSFLNGNEILRLNPGLASEQIFRAAELQKRYAVEIENVTVLMEKMKDEINS